MRSRCAAGGGSLRKTAAAAMATLAAWGTSVAALAADANDPAGGDWSFQVTPYVWMAALEGDVATISRLPTVDVDASFSDILDHADFTLMLLAELRYRRTGFLVDLAYLDLSGEEDAPGPLFSEAELDTRTFFATLAPFYRALEAERGVLDLFAGLRVWSVDTELDFEPGLLAGRSADDDESWADPILGARGRVRLADSLFLSAGGDVGGFGAASDFTWQATGTLDLQPWDRVAIRAGYRHLEVDYDHGGFVWDVSMDGPILGLSVRF